MEDQKLKQVEKVTSNKSPGRIAAGKKLAEWNRQKKLNNQTKQKLLANEENEVKIPTTTKEGKEKSNKIWIIGGGLVAVGYGGYKLYKWYIQPKTIKTNKSQPKITKTQEEKQSTINLKSAPDPFQMD